MGRGRAGKRVVPVYGDRTAKRLGVSADDIRKLKGHVDHVHHLAAVYDLSADAEAQIATNLEGTRAVVEFAGAIDAGHLHHVRPIAAAGLYEGVMHALVPRVAQIVVNSTFRMFPDSAAAQGDKSVKYQPSAEAVAMAQMMRRIHF